MVNSRYRRISSSIGIKSRHVKDATANTTIGSTLVTFTTLEQIHRLIDARDLTAIKVLQEVTLDELRNETPAATDEPTRWAVYRVIASSVTVMLDAQAQTSYQLMADGLEEAATLSGSTEPAFPESYHDILVEGAIADELKKDEKLTLAKDAEAVFQRRLSELRLHLAVSPGLVRRQGQRESAGSTSGVGGGGSANSGAQNYTQTGLITFDRDTDAPFAVTDTSAYVANLFAEGVGNLATDKLVGRDTTGTGESEAIGVTGGLEFTGSQSIQIADLGVSTAKLAADGVTFAKMQNIATDSLIGRDTASSGDPENITLNATLSMDGAGALQRAALTGDVTASAGSNATTIAVDVVTYAKIQNISAASRLLGRGSASGAGDPEEVAIGSGLSMSGTTLSATAAVGGSDTQVQFNDGGVLGGDAGLTYDKTTDTLTITGDLSVGGGDIICAANTVIRRNTTDANDSGSVTITGGGGASSIDDRGSSIATFGNEHATQAGWIEHRIGPVANSVFVVRATSPDIAALNILGSDGSATFTSSKSTNAWVLNGTDTNGGYLEVQLSGSYRGRIGNAEAIDSALGANTDFAIKASNILYLEGTDTAGVRSKNVMNNTSGSAANMVIDGTSGAMYRSTSSRRYKQNIRTAGANDWRVLLDLRPTVYRSLGSDKHEWHTGFIAEEVCLAYRAKGLRPDGAVTFDAKGRPDWVQYPHFVVPLTQGVQAHETRLNDLEARIAALEAA